MFKLLLFFSPLFSSTLFGFSALLLEIDNDYMFHFSYKDRAFYCRPAAITTIDQLFLYPDKPKVCMDSARAFVKKYPYANKQFAYKLHEEQKYEVIGLKDECFVMLNAGVSFSTHLVAEGFAVLRSNLSKEFLNTIRYKNLLKNQEKAQYHGKGIWSDDILPKCF